MQAPGCNHKKMLFQWGQWSLKGLLPLLSNPNSHKLAGFDEKWDKEWVEKWENIEKL